MKNILFVIPYLGGGGAERVLIDLMNVLNRQQKYNITLFTIGSGILDDQLDSEIKHVKLVKVNLANQDMLSKIKIKVIFKVLKMLSPARMRSFLNRFLRENFDVEIAFLEGFPIKFVSQSNSKKIGWIHTDLNRFNYCKSYFKGKSEEMDSYSKMDKTAFVSELCKEGYLEYFNHIDNHNNLYVMKNLLNIERIIALSKESVNLDFKYICSVGRLSDEKGFDRLIKGYYRLKDEGHINNLKLVIIGSGKKENDLKNLVANLKLEGDILFIPFNKNPYKYIRNGEFFVSSSRVEGYPTVVLEALILEKSVIATNTGASTILNAGEFGLVVPNNSDGIIDGMKELICNSPLYTTKALSGKKMVLNQNRHKLNEIIEFLER